MTGTPAETWQEFRFKTVPGWASASNALAFTGLHLLAPIVEEAAMRRASGYLPLTHASRRKLRLVNWTFFGLIPLTLLLWTLTAVVGLSSGSGSSWFGILVVSGLLTLTAGLLGMLYIAPLVGPSGRVMARQAGQYDSLVELRRVHPAFVAAVNQMHQARAAYYTALAASRKTTTTI